MRNESREQRVVSAPDGERRVLEFIIDKALHHVRPRDWRER